MAALERVPFSERVSAGTTYELLAEVVRRDPGRDALVYEPAPGEVRILTYAELLEQVTRAANVFAGLADGPGGVVAYLLPNALETHVIVWGAEAAGVACALNPLLEPDHLAGIVEAARATTLVAWGADETWRKACEIEARVPSLRALVRVGESETLGDAIDYERAIGASPGDRLVYPPPGPDDVAAYFPTGGTTGLPKVVQHTHANEVAAATIGALAFGISRDDVVVSGMPLFHAAGVVFGLVGLSQGATLVLVGEDGFRSRWVLEGGFWDAVERHGGTVFPVVPTALAALRASWTPTAVTTTLRYGVCGAAFLSEGLHDEFETLTGVPILPCYALTEATLAVTVAARDGERALGSAGVRAPYVDLAVADRSGATPRWSDVGEVGSIVVRGPCLFPGYLQPRHGEGAWLEEGWFDTGDLGRLDEEGRLWVTGRSKDIIIRGGHNIDPAVIEECLLAHPAVALAAAVGRPDPYAGEVPIAYVMLKPAATVGEGELAAHAMATISERAASPKEIVVLDALPLTGIGKVFKPALRRDATRRAVEQLAAEAGVAATVTVVEDPERGLIATVALPGRADVDEDLARQLGRLPVAVVLEGDDGPLRE